MPEGYKTIHDKVQMQCPWCNYRWTQVFIKRAPTQTMKCSKCGKFARTPQKDKKPEIPY